MSANLLPEQVELRERPAHLVVGQRDDRSDEAVLRVAAQRLHAPEPGVVVVDERHERLREEGGPGRLDLVDPARREDEIGVARDGAVEAAHGQHQAHVLVLRGERLRPVLARQLRIDAEFGSGSKSRVSTESARRSTLSQPPPQPSSRPAAQSVASSVGASGALDRVAVRVVDARGHRLSGVVVQVDVRDVGPHERAEHAAEQVALERDLQHGPLEARRGCSERRSSRSRWTADVAPW